MAILTTPIALDPAKGGGRSISDAALEPADLIVSTTRAGVSGVIRVGTTSVVSHASLYVGGGEVVEAVGEGVVVRELEVALAHAALAVAYRAPGLDAATAARVVAYATAQVGTPYSAAGAVLSTDKVLCRVLGPRPASFFCSQLVMEAYKRAGRPLSSSPSQCVTPQDAVVIARRQLAYVGHLLGRASWFPVLAP